MKWRINKDLIEAYVRGELHEGVALEVVEEYTARHIETVVNTGKYDMYPEFLSTRVTGVNENWVEGVVEITLYNTVRDIQSITGWSKAKAKAKAIELEAMGRERIGEHRYILYDIQALTNTDTTNTDTTNTDTTNTNTQNTKGYEMKTNLNKLTHDDTEQQSRMRVEYMKMTKQELISKIYQIEDGEIENKQTLTKLVVDEINKIKNVSRPTKTEIWGVVNTLSLGLGIESNFEFRKLLQDVFAPKVTKQANKGNKLENGLYRCRYTNMDWAEEFMVFANANKKSNHNSRGYSKIGIKIWHKHQNRMKKFQQVVLKKMLANEEVEAEVTDLKVMTVNANKSGYLMNEYRNEMIEYLTELSDQASDEVEELEVCSNINPFKAITL